MVVFSCCGDVAADGAESLGSGEGSEASAYFLFEFGHAYVSFGWVVVEGYAEVVHEPEGFSLVVPQAVEQVFGRGLFASSSPLFLWLRRRGVKL